MRWLLLAVALLPVAACGDDADDGELVVLAASSLTGAFGAIETAFEEAHPDVDVVLTFDSSSTLAAQVAEGAPAGVLATADESTMQAAVGSGEVSGDPVRFAANAGVLAVSTGSDLTSPEDLEGDVVLAVCAEGVPCRAVADDLFDQLGIDPGIDSEEENVSAVLTKLESGDVDAGVVYVTDDLASDAVEALPLPEGVEATTSYPIVAVDDDAAARAFVDFVTGEEGQAILREAGFRAP